MSILGYLPPLIAFSATLIGLIGPFRKQDKTGFGAITAYGWTSCSLAAVSLCVGMYLTYTKEAELSAKREAQQRMQGVVRRELNGALLQLRAVLYYMALAPYRTMTIESRQSTLAIPPAIPYSKYQRSGLYKDIDLSSKEVIQVLENSYISPRTRLKGTLPGGAMPFGTSVSRLSMDLIVEETNKASQAIKTTLGNHATSMLSPDIFESTSHLLDSPFLNHLANLKTSWLNRAEMEDSESAITINFRFLNSGISGSSTKDYLELVSQIERTLSLLADEKQSTAR